ncbi:MAG TPA: type I restriction-modification enzyme R subunit C-terminal domain-containing protein [Steroidobacteraceae bacterium]|nr:type I restriction-modification enzyme R subunit C-terminal domain-containing protein [Steroidobacteraceae bacterium]
MCTDRCVASDQDLLRAREESKGLDRFVRSLVGLDREAAQKLFGAFLAGRTLNSNQIEFIDLIIDYLAQHETIDVGRLYESPFTDFSPRGVEGVFTAADSQELMRVLDQSGQH